jgi:hypothetical protein
MGWGWETKGRSGGGTLRYVPLHLFKASLREHERATGPRERDASALAEALEPGTRHGKLAGCLSQ